MTRTPDGVWIPAIHGLVSAASLITVGACGSTGWACSGAKFRQFEVENLGVTELGHKNIGGLDVAVNDALGVRCIEGAGDVVSSSSRWPVGRGRLRIRSPSAIPSSNSITMKY